MKPLFSIAFVCILALSCRQNEKVFQLVQSGQTGVHFSNNIYENDSINILNLEYVYNGGGVAIADFNNDSLQDIFFTGNMVSNKLYINKGKFRFEDISDRSGITDSSQWNTGVAAIDINQDGLMDIYVCSSIKKDPELRANRLYINLGNDKEGFPKFEEQGKQYNVADTGYSTNAAFFDYDNDGDLDLYVLTNKMAEKNEYPNQYRPILVDGSAANTDRLYRNDFDKQAGHPVFTNVSREAGILVEGYGLGVNISDINQDGWKDIYITNDFLSNDIIYINNKDGSFTNRVKQYLKHTSYSAMGNDVADINNDGLPDIIAVDMLPESNFRKKMMMSANSYQNYVNNDQFGYQYQYGRNTLQLNLGFAKDESDSAAHPVFADIAYFAGVAETDWSWTPMVTDFDNDGFKDMIITNGFPKDITDHDFMTYRVNASKIAAKDELLGQIPEVKLMNYAFRNNSQNGFENVSAKWGLDKESFSSGAAYGDLDNDGDLDCVISNINDKPFIYRNQIRENDESKHHYLQVKFKGSKQNRDGLGAIVELYYGGGKKQYYEHSPYRGYISSVQAMAHFGLDSITSIDSLIVIWPDQKKQVLTNLQADQVLVVRYENTHSIYQFPVHSFSTTDFLDITKKTGINFVHKEYDFADFNIQKLLPHKLSEYGPGMAVGDIDGNGYDDIVIGGSFGYSATLLFQNSEGTYLSKPLIKDATPSTKASEDLGILLFDADGDNDRDLYIASGGYESQPMSSNYRDFFFINDGKGNFRSDTSAFPPNFISNSCVRACDYDNDGDLDIFVAGRVDPWHYPRPVSSKIYRNDSNGSSLKFTDASAAVPGLDSIGMICDALFTDFNNDGWTDLVLAGEWMPLQFLRNDKGHFTNITEATGLSKAKGWWNSIVPGDFDNDGDIDYVAGNLGLNSFYKASPNYPVKIYARDFDNNNSLDAISTLYLRDEKGELKEFPAQTRDDLIKQIISMRGKFQTYKAFATAGIDKILSENDLKEALILEANHLKSSYIRNNGDGTFTMIDLPAESQLSLINGMVAEDFDHDGNLDLLMNTNDYGTEVSVGRYDALNGLLLKGNGDGSFVAVQPGSSGIFIRGNSKGIVALKGFDGLLQVVSAENRGPLRVYAPRTNMQMISVADDDVSATIVYKNGKRRRTEFYFGASFLSQSGRHMVVDPEVQSITVSNRKGSTRRLL